MARRAKNSNSGWNGCVAKSGNKFPEKVTAFREEMAAHGKYGQPCPRCGGKIQRIRYAANETDYCPTCQTNGRLLADRALSRLLREDWPRTPEELENFVSRRRVRRCIAMSYFLRAWSIDWRSSAFSVSVRESSAGSRAERFFVGRGGGIAIAGLLQAPRRVRR